MYLFDELETVATLLGAITQRLLSYEFLNLLIDGRRHAHCYFAFGATPDFGWKLESDWEERLLYEPRYPEAYRFVNKWRSGEAGILQLKQIGASDLVSLCKNLKARHEEAFDWKMDGQFSDAALEAYVVKAHKHSLGTRELVKSLVDMMDLAEQHRHLTLVYKG